MKGVNTTRSTAGEYLQSNSSRSATDEAAEQRLRKWASKLRSVSLRDLAGAQKFFEEITQGFAPPDDAPKAQAVFNDLLAHEAYGVFVEVFTLYNDLRKHQARGPDEPPFKASLTLQLPCRWKPTWPAAFNAALERVQVERLEVIRPAVYEPSAMTVARDRLNDFASGVRSRLDSQGSTYRAQRLKRESEAQRQRAEAEKIANDPVPAAVCEGIQTLLQGETAELVVRGRLKSPMAVAEAVARSARLRSIELGELDPWEGDPEDLPADLKADARELARHAPDPRTLTPAKMNSYETLMGGLARCKTLENFSISQEALVKLHIRWADFDPEHAHLKSVRVMRPSDPLEIYPMGSDIVAFMKGVAAFRTLTEVSLHTRYWSLSDLVKGVFEPLANHPTLTKLEIVQDGSSFEGANSLSAMPSAVAFWTSCPSLTHFTLDGGHLRESNMAWSLQAAPAFDAQATAVFRRNPTCRLRSLTMTGVLLPPQYFLAFCEMLGENTSLEDVNLSGCCVNVETALKLPNILKNNWTLRTCRLPLNLRNYFWVSKNGGIYGISKRGELVFDEQVQEDAAVRKSAKTAYETVRKEVARAPTAAQALLDQRAMEAANSELRGYVGRFMSMAASPKGMHAFDDPAGLVMGYLGDAKSLREVVHLTEVGTAVDLHQLHKGGQTPASVKALVRAANADAVSKELPTAPLKVNTVNAGGANLALRSAARNIDPDEVRRLVAADAINFKGLVDRDVRSRKVLAALRPPVTTTTASVVTTGTSTATATTTATTSTTTTTTTTATPTAVHPDGTKTPKKG